MAKLFDADIIIVGGGTAGLLLAHELSQDAELTIRVFEAGKDCSGHSDVQDVFKYTANIGSDRDWYFESVTQLGFNGRSAVQSSGKLLGGSSSINGGFYVAPSAAGVNAWAELGNPTWSYEKVQQACLKTIRVHPPDEGRCHDIGLDNDKAVGSGPVHVVTEIQRHPVTEAYFSAVRNMGYRTTSSIFNDKSAFSQPLSYTQDPSTMTRSDANTAFVPSLKQRPNVTISLESTVKKVILSGTPPEVIANGVEVVASDGSTRSFFASKEVILSAGALATPKLLELSGIGRSDLLRKHGIAPVIEIDGVGERLRNHVLAAVHCELSKELPATTLGLKASTWMCSKDQPGLVEKIQRYAGPTHDQAYDREVKRILLDPKEASAVHFLGSLGVPNSYTFGVISAIPFSQGTTHIASADINDKPTVDPAFYSHPLDLEFMSSHLRTAASLASEPMLKPLFKIDDRGRPVGPPDFADMDDVKRYLRENSATAYHASGTAAMRPREDEGVVDEQLKVYDTLNLRVVDASVIPLIPHGNTMAVVYGIAKRAAEMIKGVTISY